MPLFEVAILLKPTKKEREESGAFETLVVAPEAVVAADPQSAAIMVATKAAVAMTPNHEVLVRPFA